jgi:hypothetical protein
MYKYNHSNSLCIEVCIEVYTKYIYSTAIVILMVQFMDGRKESKCMASMGMCTSRRARGRNMSKVPHSRNRGRKGS